MATRGKRDKRDIGMGLCNCVAAVFQVLVAFQSMSFISGQDPDFQPRKILNDVSLFPKQQPYGGTSGSQNFKDNLISNSNTQIGGIRFEPPFLDFDTECVGMPKLRTVYIRNPHKEYDLHLSSISARTSHFHASFFDKKTVPPGGNTSFEVVFLARVVGNVENTLFINTMYGTHAYQVFGIGVPNPYRLRPYLGAKVSINSTFSPLISMHNPTSETLQVTEMYSSSGYLQLQLPQGQHELDKEQWAIPPYETREVIRARFMGQVEANHTAFIRIKTEQNEESGPDFHILPVEVEVSSDPGLYSALELLDFGLLRTRYDEPKSLPLFLLNSGDREVQISSVSLASPNPAVKISFNRVKLKHSQTMFTLVANVTFSAYLANSEEDQKGLIIVKSKDKGYKSLEIPYFVNLLEGTLGYDQQGVLFHFETTKTKKEVNLSNFFKFPVVLQSLTLPPEASKIFKVLDFSPPVTLPLSMQMAPFSIEYNPGKLLSKIAEDITDEEPGSVYHLSLHTNASRFQLPLYIFSGRISYKVLREDKRKIDFGIMGTNDRRKVLFALYNHNPTKILLEKINSTLKNLEIRIVSLTEEESGKNRTYEEDFRLENFWLPTNSCSVFEVTITATDAEEEIADSIKIVTKYQEITIPVFSKIVIGSLTVKPEKIKFSKSFPGRIVHQTLTVVNTFAQSTKIDYVHAEQVDSRFHYKKLKNHGMKLDPNKPAKIGKVYFDARQGCKPDRCYTGLPTSTKDGNQWLTSLALSPESVKVDADRYKSHRDMWHNVQSQGLTGANTTLVLSADVLTNVRVPVQATLYWPTLLRDEELHFPLTHIGRRSAVTLKLVNPADCPVIVQVLPLSLYPQPEAMMDTLGWEERLRNESFVLDNSSVFQLQDPRQDSAKNSASAHMVWLTYSLNGKLNHSAINLFMEPGDKIDLQVEFTPYDDRPKSTVVLLRNNLTIIDAIPLYGRGAYEHITLGGKAPNGKNSVLRFKLTRELLKDCITTRKKLSPSFTVRKWFYANNTGVLPIHITSMTVSGSPCEGYGFRVLDCDQFILLPNSSKKIEIAYTPDFTSHMVLHKLRLVTSQANEMVFTLNVTLPPYMLPLCQETVPRPSWEPTLYYFVVSIIVILSVGVLLMGWVESVAIWDLFLRTHQAEIQYKRSVRAERESVLLHFGKPFDLKKIGNSYTPANGIADDGDFSDSSCGHNSTDVTTSFMRPPARLPDKSERRTAGPESPGLFSKILSYFRPAEKTRTRKPSFNECLQTDEIAKATAANGSPQNGSNETCLRLRHVAVNTEKRKNDKKFRSLDVASLNCNDRYLKPTAEIRPVAQNSESPKGKNQSARQSEKLAKPVVEDLSPKRKDESRERSSESDVSVDVERPTGKRRTDSKSRLASRESTSSSEGLYSPEPATGPGQCVCRNQETEYADAEEAEKPARSRKPKKLTRKQLKALAKEKETVRKDSFTNLQPAKAVSTSTAVEEISKEKQTVEKKSRQPKRRSEPTVSNGTLAAPAPTKKPASNGYQTHRTLSSRTKESKSIQKRRSYSYSADGNSRPKDKPGKITICKRSSPLSSSSHDISESSGSEGSAQWDTPCRTRDADEDMRQIAKQSRQAERAIAASRRKEKRGKGATSPVILSSGSRSSSYSSLMSSASNDSNSSRPGSLGVSGNASSKLTRSMSDTSGGAPLFKKRAARRKHDSNTLPTQPPRFEMRNASSPPQQNQFGRPTRAMSSPSSMPAVSAGASGTGFSGSDEQWTRPSQIVESSYSAFGDSPFNLGELIGSRRHNSSLSTTWESAFSDNSSFYTVPSPPAPPVSHPQHWNSARPPIPQHGGYPPQYDAPPGTPTTPGVFSQAAVWGEALSPVANSNMTTHSIWSVSNAVTMDEDRNVEEPDPLGVRNIWTDPRHHRRWNDSR